VSSFDDATALVSDADGIFHGALDPEWWGGIGPHGGYAAAILARAALTKADRGQELRSLTVHFLQSGRQGPVEVDYDVMRATRSATTVRLAMRQQADVVLAGIATLLKGRSCPEIADAVMPVVPLAEETPISHFLVERGVSDMAPAFASQLVYRHCVGPDPLSGGREALTGGWLQRRDRGPIDCAGATMLMDAWWPAVWSRLRQVPRTPTVDLTVHFRQRIPQTGEPLLAVFRSGLGIDGFIDEEGELWSADGRLLVQSKQLAVLLASPDAI
jgi:hypothetical protein